MNENYKPEYEQIQIAIYGSFPSAASIWFEIWTSWVLKVKSDGDTKHRI